MSQVAEKNSPKQEAEAGSEASPNPAREPSVERSNLSISSAQSAPTVIPTTPGPEETRYTPATLPAVRRALNATKREIVLETEAMISAAKAEVLGRTVGITELDRQADDIRLLSRGLTEVQERMEQLEEKLNLLLASRDRKVEPRTSRSPIRRGRRETQRDSPRRHRAERDLSPNSESVHSDLQSVRSHASTTDRLRRDYDELVRRRDAKAEGYEDGFVPRKRQPWKGPKAFGLTEIQPSDPRFAYALSYRQYRLLNTDQSRGPEVERDTGVYTRRMSHTMAPLIFDGSKPLFIIQFLRTLKNELDGNGRSEGAALLLCPKFMAGDALETFNAQFDLANDGLGGFQTWPEAVQFLLRTYAKDAYIEEALADLDDCEQEPTETEEAFAKRLKVKTRMMAGVFTQQDLITKFLRGCHASLKPVLRHTRRLYDGPNAFQDFLEQAVAQGEANRALLQRTRMPVTVSKERKSVLKPRRVMALESPYDDGRAMATVQEMSPDADGVNYVGREGVEDLETVSEGTEYTRRPSSDTFHTAQAAMSNDVEEEPEAEVVNAVQSPRQFRHSRPMGQFSNRAKPKPQWTPSPRPPFPDKRSQPPRPTKTVKWESFQPASPAEEICFDCYQEGHRKPECPFQSAVRSDFFTAFITKNYFKLSPPQQQWLQERGQTKKKEGRRRTSQRWIVNRQKNLKSDQTRKTRKGSDVERPRRFRRDPNQGRGSRRRAA